MVDAKLIGTRIDDVAYIWAKYVSLKHNYNLFLNLYQSFSIFLSVSICFRPVLWSDHFSSVAFHSDDGSDHEASLLWRTWSQGSEMDQKGRSRLFGQSRQNA